MENVSVVIPNFNDRRDTALKITLSKDQSMSDVLHIFLKGRIDTYNAEFFQDRLNKIFEYGIVKLVFRCSSLESVSSAGLGVFANSLDKFVQKGGVFVFADLQPKVNEVFQLLGFNKLFHIAATMKDVEYFIRGEDKMQKKVFPLLFCCPICDKRLSATKSGRFRCSNCKSVITISDTGVVTF